jgi:hypothetical protein
VTANVKQLELIEITQFERLKIKIQADSLDQIGSLKSRKRSLYQMWTRQNFLIFLLQGRSLV